MYVSLMFLAILAVMPGAIAAEDGSGQSFLLIEVLDEPEELTGDGSVTTQVLFGDLRSALRHPHEEVDQLDFRFWTGWDEEHGILRMTAHENVDPDGPQFLTSYLGRVNQHGWVEGTYASIGEGKFHWSGRFLLIPGDDVAAALKAGALGGGP